MKLAALLLQIAVVLLAGCQPRAPVLAPATDPVSVSPIEGGTGSRHTLRQEPHRAAVCVARNIDAHRKALQARIREGRDPVLIEVHVSAATLVALTQHLLAADGSTVIVWTAPVLPGPRAELVSVMIQGC